MQHSRKHPQSDKLWWQHMAGQWRLFRQDQVIAHLSPVSPDEPGSDIHAWNSQFHDIGDFTWDAMTLTETNLDAAMAALENRAHQAGLS